MNIKKNVQTFRAEPFICVKKLGFFTQMRGLVLMIAGYVQLKKQQPRGNQHELIASEVQKKWQFLVFRVTLFRATYCILSEQFPV